MPKASTLINNFNSGELGPLIEARSDIAKYGSGCKTLENALPLVEGGAKKMPGTYYVGSTRDGGTSKSRLVKFAFNTGQEYECEFGVGYIRFYKDGGLIINEAPPGTILGTSATSITAGAGLIGTSVALNIVPPGALVSVGNVISVIGNPTSGARWLGNVYGQEITAASSLVGQVLVFQSKAPTQDFTGDVVFISSMNLTPNATISGTVTSQILVAGGGSLANTYQFTITVSAVTGSGTDTDWQLFSPGSGTVSATITGTVTSAIVIRNPTTFALAVAITVTAVTGTGTGDAWNIESANSSYLVEVSTPYQEDDLFELDINTQSADMLYIFHRKYQPATLARYSDTNWVWSPLVCSGAPDIANNVTGIPKQISSISTDNPAKVTTYAAHGYKTGDIVYMNGLTGPYVGWNYSLFVITVIDSIRFTTNGNAGSPTAYTPGGYCIQSVQLFAADGDYPSCGTFYQQRLFVGGSDHSPLKILGSVTGDYQNFMTDPNEDDYGVQYTLASGKMDRIRWMMGQTYLMIGSAGGVWAMSGGQMGSPAPLTQTSVDAERQITTGVGVVSPQIVNDALIWITRSTKSVRLAQYDFMSNQFIGPDLTRMNRQITRGLSQALSGVVQTAFQAEPYPILWCVRADGQLLGMTYEKSEQVFAWFRIVTDGIIESVSVISQDNDEDQVWIIVKRTINDVVKRYVEYFTPQEIYSDLANSFFVHCGLSWDGGASSDITGITNGASCVVSAANSFSNGDKVSISGVTGMTQVNNDPSSAYTISEVTGSSFRLSGIDSTSWGAYVSGGTVKKVTNELIGLAYLLGKTVVVVGDGALVYEGAVVGDTVTLPYYCNLIAIGLPYTTTVEPMNPILGSSQGTSRGKKQKVSRATLCFYETMGCKVGIDTDHLYDIPMGTGTKPALFTGDITVDLDGEWDDQSTISIVHDQPFPFTLKAVAPVIEVNG